MRKHVTQLVGLLVLAIAVAAVGPLQAQANTVKGDANGTTVAVNGTMTATVVTSVELKLDSTTGIAFTSIAGDGTSSATFTLPFGSVDARGIATPAAGASVNTAATVDGSAFTGAVYWSPYSMNIRVSGGGTGTVTVLQTPAPTLPFGTTATKVRVVDCSTNTGCTTFTTVPSTAPELTLVSGVADNTTNSRSVGISVPPAVATGTGSATVRWTLTGM